MQMQSQPNRTKQVDEHAQVLDTKTHDYMNKINKTHPNVCVSNVRKCTSKV